MLRYRGTAITSDAAYRELDDLLAGGAPRLGRRLKGDIFGWGREDYCWPCGCAPLPAPPLLS
jgi:hypothetical protein